MSIRTMSQTASNYQIFIYLCNSASKRLKKYWSPSGQLNKTVHTVISQGRRLKKKATGSLWTREPGEEEGRAISRKILSQNGEKYLSQGYPFHIPSLGNKGGIGGGNWEVPGPQNGGT